MNLKCILVLTCCCLLHEVVPLSLFSFAGINVRLNTKPLREFFWRQESNDVDYKSFPLNTAELIKSQGYPAEEHAVTTEDGYILAVYRIPCPKNVQPEPKPILLQHGLLSSSADWVIQDKENGLAFLLADAGYDVWLSNFRGNTESEAFSNSSKGKEYWDFSWHENGIYDLPAVITYITNMTGNPLEAYIGHSMGTTSFYVMSAERPEFQEKVKLMISLAPVAFMNHLKSPLRYVAPLAKDIKKLMYFFGEYEFLPHNQAIKFLAKYGCSLYAIEERICSNVIFVIVGFDPAQFNQTLLPRILHYNPAGCSAKTLVHYTQLINSGHFRQYDYGPEKNMVRYNSLEPPDYDLSQITVPVVLMYGENDWLASVIDVKRLQDKLPNVVESYKVPYPKWNHVDFLWGIDARKLIYKPILRLLEKHKTKFNI